MCGIAGIIGTNKVDVSIASMLNKIKHRGPDGLFYWQEGSIALGHARLSIIDLDSRANQPMIDQTTGNVIIYNGEIYNYLEIKTAIGSKYKFKTCSDTEVILAAYSVYGIEFLDHLQGMFAFVIYDKARQKLLCARDRMGIKPFYYRTMNGALLFASEIKALIRLENEGETVNSLKAYEFLANRQLDTNQETFFEGILQLKPASYMWVDMDGSKGEASSYWQYPSLGQRQLNPDAQAEFRALFDKTISIHLRSDVAVGSFLSGGLDSSSITCFALRNMTQECLHTFSGILPYHHAENVLIKEVLAASNKLIPHDFLLDGESFFDDIGAVIYHHDEPILDGSMYAHFKLCQLAKNAGIKVLLSGSGGDELFGGYEAHLNAHHATLLGRLQLGKYFRDMHQVAKNSDRKFSALLLKSMYECVPFKVRRHLKNKQVKSRNSHLEMHPFIEHYHYEHADSYYANLLNYYKSWSVPPYLHYEDRNSMAFGVETRVPFYDHKLLDFVFQFAPDQLINGSSKSMLRNSFRGIVPDKVLSQKGKYGFPSPIDHALIKSQKGKELFFDLHRNTPFLKAKETAQVGIDFYNGKGNLTVFWRLLSYMIWYEKFFTQTMASVENE